MTMCISCDNLASLLGLSNFPMTRRGFGLGLGATTALPGLLVLGGSFACTEVQAQTSAALPAPVSKMHTAIDADAPRLIEIFKDLHANPELGFMEIRTAGIVERELKTNGFNVRSGIGKTGVVGVMENGPGPIVMFRADMDCNAVEEITGLPYSSKKRVTRTTADGRPEEVPVMHACGHDAHVTWLIGLAKAMAANKSEWKGTLVMVGQPAEEPIEGARAMVKDGLYSQGVPKPDYLLAMHTTPLPTGIVIGQIGDLMAGTDQLDVTFYGVGGHGSMPHLAKIPF